MPPPVFRVLPLTVLLDDGQILHVKAINPDFIAWEEARAQHGWPDPQGTNSPFQLQCYLAWHAARRTGAIPLELAYDDFKRTRCHAIAEGDPETVDPTRPGPGPG